MPRTEAENQRIREAQRAKILDGARKAFARKGLTVTMAEVADAAGVSQGLAYRYFANKEALLHALLEQAIQASSDGFQRLLEMPGTPGERLTFLLSRILESRRDHPELYLLFYPELSDQVIADDIRALIDKQGQAFLETLRSLIVAGQATGEITGDDPDQLVISVLAYLDGLTRAALYYPEQVSKHFPDPRIILRIFKPSSDQQASPSQSAGAG
jgi:AcrR family transcriptional regulator